MEYPVSGSISVGRFHATSEEDLVSLHKYLLETVGEVAALELGDLFPEVFIKTYSLTLTQKQVNLLHLLLGHVSSREAFTIDQVLEEHVSPEVFERYDLVSYNFDSEDGLNIRIE